MGHAILRLLRPATAVVLYVLLLALPIPLINVAGFASAESLISVSFDACEVGKPPNGWISSNGKVREVYSVHVEDTGKFLHADARGTSTQIGLEKKWSLQDLPVIEWRWRAIQFPTNTDERYKNTNDSVLALYVLFGSPPFYQAIKYIWSDTLSVGSSFDSPYSSRVKMIVIESGRALAGKWVVERRNVLSDYRRVFNTPHAQNPTGIAVLTDADDTNSRAVGDYGEIHILPLGQTDSKPKPF